MPCQNKSVYWTVEIEGLDWTKERKIWNFESAKAVYEQEKDLP